MYEERRKFDSLRIEREIFPQCIQAPVKYFNRNKSFQHVNRNNKRPFSLPGELTSPLPLSKIERSNKHVSDWLDQTEKNIKKLEYREPFTDLDINCVTRNDFQNNNSRYPQPLVTRNSLYLKHNISDVKDNICRKQHNISKRACNLLKTKSKSSVIDICDESSNSDCKAQVLDKDQIALMEVHKMEHMKKTYREAFTEHNEKRESKKSDIFRLRKNVPFFKHGYLSQDRNNIIRNIKKFQYENNKIILTIKTNSIFTELICKSPNKSYCTKSTSAQTDSMPKTMKASGEIYDLLNDKQEIGYLEKEHINVYKSSNIIIQDSDEEINANKHSIKIEVKADVHRPADICANTLTEITPDFRRCITRAATKRPTPASSDSSEKENYDPNRCSKRIKKKKNAKNYHCS